MNTKDYYELNAKEFIESTIDSDMSEIYELFERHINPKSRILDLGFGSGRDSLYFLKKGYDIYSMDIVDAFIENAVNAGLPNVIKGSALDIQFKNYFDAVFACASLLHIKKEDLTKAFKSIADSLKPKGILYCSFKYGDYSGDRNGRFFVDFDEESIKEYLLDTNLVIIETRITTDVRSNNSGKWLNLIIKKL